MKSDILKQFHKAILKKTSISGVAAGWCEWELFFSFLQKKIFFSKMDYFPTEKKN